MMRKRLKEILGNLHFSNNEVVVPWDHQAHDRAFKVRRLIDYLNECFLSSMEPGVEESGNEHMIKCKGRGIMRQHIKYELIKWVFRMWHRCTPKTWHLCEFDIYTGKKDTADFRLGESVVLQLTEKLNGSFCYNFLWQFFHCNHRPWEIWLTTNCMRKMLFDKTESCYRKLKNRQRRNLKQKRNRRSYKNQKNSFMGHFLLVKSLSIVEIVTTSWAKMDLLLYNGRIQK